MGFFGGILIKIIKLILYLAIVISFIVIIPNLPPYTKFSRIEVEPTQPRVGALAPNNVLNNVEPLYKDKLLGPEAFQIWNGEVYTGLATGEIVKVSPGGHVTFVTKIGQPCTGLVQEHICGRPLGFVIDEKNKLMYVADAYHGIWKVNLTTNKKQLLVSPHLAIDERVPKIFNSVALDNKGNLYWTDSSSDFHLRDGVMAVLSDPTGRLFYYNAVKNSSKVLLDNIWFANGLVVSPDDQYVLVAETSRYRVIKYYINGPKKGSSEVFVAGLPGLPDNIRVLPDGSGVLVSLYSVFDDEHPLLLKTMSTAPLARKFLARLIRLIEIPFEFLHSQFPNHIFENIVHQIGSFGSFASLSPGQAGLVQIDWNGNIVSSYYNTDGSVVHISDAVVFNNKLYTGCPHLQNFIGAVPAPSQLVKAFTVSKAPVKEQSKVETKLPKIKLEETKEIPKNSKPAAQPIKQTTPQPPTTKQPTTKPSAAPKEDVVKLNTVSKETKAKVVPKESTVKQTESLKADIKQKEQVVHPKIVAKPEVTLKQGDEKPKLVSKDTEAKPKAESKESVPKPKVVPQTETKPKVEQKDADLKVKVAPKKTAEPPNIKETENKVKISKDDTAKAKTGSEQSKTNQLDSKKATKAAEPKAESREANAKPKPVSEPKLKKVDTEPVKKKSESESSIKPIPVEENIASDTAKPNKEMLKVIKKSGPQEIPNPNL